MDKNQKKRIKEITKKNKNKQKCTKTNQNTIASLRVYLFHILFKAKLYF